ncbi:hypothetical protein [Bradyrhizobium sp. WYCCWR 12699]|uniref:hypothetical protein n=1 Tax=Bradyrhizobium sp. WYCCWR 12699 TaxID=3064203 RepID=UPI0028A4C390|nr:hypothetical protein [Bradyrhizobium sp. WYCCWR 12699]MDT4737232.1 hypothetical protein [Bradyrhizobium sp. WYCCWR 12699]
MHDIDAELSPLPSPLEVAEGFYLANLRDEGLDHHGAVAKAVEQLLNTFPELSPLQATLVMARVLKASIPT